MFDPTRYPLINSHNARAEWETLSQFERENSAFQEAKPEEKRKYAHMTSPAISMEVLERLGIHSIENIWEHQEARKHVDDLPRLLWKAYKGGAAKVAFARLPNWQSKIERHVIASGVKFNETFQETDNRTWNHYQKKQEERKSLLVKAMDESVTLPNDGQGLKNREIRALIDQSYEPRWENLRLWKYRLGGLWYVGKIPSKEQLFVYSTIVILMLHYLFSHKIDSK